MALAKSGKIMFILINIIAISLLLAVLLYLILRPNPYCDPSLCHGNRKHVACYGNKWGPDCENYEMIEITPAMKTKIVHLHNALRNRLASGKLVNVYGEKFPMANRMGVLEWNDELAYIAGMNTKQCALAHDECRNTKEFKFSGQNIGFGWRPNEPNQFIERITLAWFQEYNVTYLAEVESISSPLGNESRQIGHFTTLALDFQTHVGCAVSTTFHKEYKKKYLLYTCNYSNTNIAGNRVYAVSTCGKACCGCIKGCHPLYHFLCAKGEDFRQKF